MPLPEEQIKNICRNSADPLYQQVGQCILQAIRTGLLAENEQLPGLPELAAAFGVSRVTAETALTELIRSGYCYRRPKKGTFVGRVLSDRGNTKRTRVFIIYSVHPEIEFDSVMMPFLAGVHHAVNQEERTRIVAADGKNAHKTIQAQCNAANSELAGVIAVQVSDYNQFFDTVRSFPRIPFVLLNFQFRDFDQIAPVNCFGVFNDEFCGGYLAGDYLLGIGCRKIALLSPYAYWRQSFPGDINYELRIRGFLQAHKDNKITPALPLFMETGGFSSGNVMDKGARCCKELLALRERPDAIFCVNDLLAAGVHNYLRANGNVDNIEIIGFDNLIPEVSFNHVFHTVQIRAKEMAAAAVRFLAHPGIYSGRQILLTPRLVIRPLRRPQNS